ncbi:MAG: phage tail tube protein [Clostridiales bacterium]|jgi:hypothetical protein|nr:phage tail tube protein [Clostridiales bacterium]
MPRQTLKANDTLFGAEGICYAVIDGNVEEMMYVKTISATVEKNKVEIPVLGQTGRKHKSGGWTGTGSMTIYDVTSIFRRQTLEYIKNGKDTYFTIYFENDDPNSGIGRQAVALKGVNFDSMIMGQLDIETEAMEVDMDFTFHDIDMPETFKPVVLE